jgi:hypothetical protein
MIDTLGRLGDRRAEGPSSKMNGEVACGSVPA